MLKIGRVHTLDSGYDMEDAIWKRELKRPKIYVVDKSSLFAAMIKTNLEGGLSCGVLCFETGQELFDNMVFDYPDIILLDFKFEFSANADHMNGLDIYQNLSEVAEIVPVIGMSSETDDRYLRQLRDSGIQEILDKNQTDFFDVLSTCVSKTLAEFKK